VSTAKTSHFLAAKRAANELAGINPNTRQNVKLIAFLACTACLTAAFAQEIKRDIRYVPGGHERQVFDVPLLPCPADPSDAVDQR
jgi:hypothetical protein